MIDALKKSLSESGVAKDELVESQAVQSDEIYGNAVADPVHSEETDGNGQFI